MAISITLKGKRHTVEATDETPLLNVVRDDAGCDLSTYPQAPHTPPRGQYPGEIHTRCSN